MTNIEAHKAIRNAIIEGSLAEVVRLIERDKSLLETMTPFGTWLHVAATHGKRDIAKWLLDNGLEINAGAGSFEGSPLDWAASEGQLEMVKFLLENGAEMDVSEPVRNPLFGAIHGGHTAVAKLLIDNGIDTTVSYTGENMTNMDAIAFAKEWGRGDIVELLETRHRK